MKKLLQERSNCLIFPMFRVCEIIKMHRIFDVCYSIPRYWRTASYTFANKKSVNKKDEKL